MPASDWPARGTPMPLLRVAKRNVGAAIDVPELYTAIGALSPPCDRHSAYMVHPFGVRISCLQGKLPACESQKRTLLPSAEASKCPTGLKATLFTSLFNGLEAAIRRACVGIPEPDSVDLILSQHDRPGLQATPSTGSSDLIKVRITSPVSGSHTLTVPSRLADARNRPSGCQDTLFHCILMPVKTCSSAPFWTLRSLMAPWVFPRG